MRQRQRVVSALVAGGFSLPVLAFLMGQFVVAADNPPTSSAAPQAVPLQSAPAQGTSPQAPPPPAAPPQSAPIAPSQPAAVAPPASPSKRVTIPPPKIVLDNNQVSGVLGKEVQSAAKEDMGRIIDVIVDRAGRARAAIIDFGGFLGVGSRKIAVDWNALHFDMVKGKELITVDLTRDQVKAAPEFHEGKPIVVLGALNAIDEFGALGKSEPPPQLSAKNPEQ